MGGELTHFNEQGASRMVNVGDKPATLRFARASALLSMQPYTLERIRAGMIAKGNVLEVARLAGIMAAKRTDELIPLCHSLPLEAVELDFEFIGSSQLSISARVQTTAKTGVEMESLVAASTAALTIYDMCKAIDKGICILHVQVEEKRGGRSGHFVRENV